jgi:hypothetical protein
LNNINKEKNSSRQKSVGNGFHFDNFHNKSKLENTNLSVQTGISEKNFQEIIKDKDKEIDELKKELQNLKEILKKKQRLSISSNSSKFKNNSNINLTLTNKTFTNNNNLNKNSASLNEEKINQQNSFLKGFHSTKAASISKINYHSSKNTINTIHKTSKNKQNNKNNNNYNSNNNQKLSFDKKNSDNENNSKNNVYKIELDKLKIKTQNLLEKYKIFSNNSN